jgi:carboxyl-terminal processing protease
VLLISTPVLGFIVIGGLLGKASTGDDTFRHLRVFEDVVSLIMNNYVEEPKLDRVMEGAMRGLADGLDPDSAYLTPKQVKALDSGETMPPADIGLELTRQY